MDDQINTKTRIPVDIAFDSSTLMIVVPVVITNIILSVLSMRCPVCQILIPVVWYLGILALFLQDRTTLEFTHGMIIIHRHFFGPVIVNLKDITRAHLCKNTWHAYRWALYFLMLAFTGYLTYDALYDNIIRFRMQTIPIRVLIYHMCSGFAMPVLFLTLFFNFRKRLKWPFFQKVETTAGKFVFYPDRPEDFEKSIADNKKEMD